MKSYSRSEIIDMARSLVKLHGGQEKAAQKIGISQSAISSALRIDVDSSERDGTLERIIRELSGGKLALKSHKRFVIEESDDDETTDEEEAPRFSPLLEMSACITLLLLASQI